MEKTLRVIVCILLALLAVSGNGCSKPSVPERHSLSVSASVLDFGKVRPTDSPINLTFDILNHGDKSIAITEIPSCCACTVVDIPKEPIPPGGKIEVVLQVNIWGRRGFFENDLTVKTATEPPLRVAIRGNIETDIWTSGQSLRCSFGPEERNASTNLTVFTAKHPDIVFENAPREDGVTLQEISRSTKNGETAIRFFVEVDTEGKDVITRTIHIVPRDSSIAPLAIPLVCYREGEGT